MKFRAVIKPAKQIFIVAVTLLVIVGFFKFRAENIELDNKGVFTKGVIYDIRSVRGKKQFKYYFYPNGIKYEGGSSTRKKIGVGDTIDILYLEKDVEINRPEFH
jgi:hypothetical protein